MLEQLPPLNLTDYILIGLILIGALQGLKRGLSGELARVFCFILSLGAGWYFYEPLGTFIRNHTRLDGKGSQLSGFLIIIVSVIALFWIGLAILRSVLDFAFKGRIEKWGGLLIGVARMSLWITTALLAVTVWGNTSLYRVMIQESTIGQSFNETVVPLYKEMAEQRTGWPLPRDPNVPLEGHEKEKISNDKTL